MSIQGARLLTLVMAGTCAFLLLLALTLQIGLGRGYSWQSDDEDSVAGNALGAIDRTPFKLPPESSFAETEVRPPFNEDRKPTPDVPADVVQPPPPTPLNIALTGVILTPQLHIAMIHDNGKNDSSAIKEGMPLPGDLGGWTLIRVKDRSAIFKEAAGDEVEVELSTAVASPKPGAPARPGAKETAGAPPQPGSKPPPPGKDNPGAKTSQAEDLQRRIEERRKQMRDEAERLKQQPNQNPPQH
jgi:general secretion pathway protein N